jgi:hypothetical protein
MHNLAMPENKISKEIDKEYAEKVISDPRFEEIINDCMMKCISDNCDEINVECEKRCFYKVCFRVAWVLYHTWYVDSVATSPTASAA